jgi:hypothetical protein
MYAVFNFGGIKPVDIHYVWKIKVPPKFISFFGYFSTINYSLEITWSRDKALMT